MNFLQLVQWQRNAANGSPVRVYLMFPQRQEPFRTVCSVVSAMFSDLVRSFELKVSWRRRWCQSRIQILVVTVACTGVRHMGECQTLYPKIRPFQPRCVAQGNDEGIRVSKARSIGIRVSAISTQLSLVSVIASARLGSESFDRLGLHRSRTK